MKDYEDNTDDEVMREHAEEMAMRRQSGIPDWWRADAIKSFAQAQDINGNPIRDPALKWRCGLLFRPGSMWIGYHWAGHNKRLCLNLIPMVTFWVTLPGGVPPR